MHEALCVHLARCIITLHVMCTTGAYVVFLCIWPSRRSMGKEHIDAVSCSTFRADCAHRHLCDASHARKGCLWQCLGTQPRSIPRQGGKGPSSWVLSLSAGECAPSEQPHEAARQLGRQQTGASSPAARMGRDKQWPTLLGGPSDGLGWQAQVVGAAAAHCPVGQQTSDCSPPAPALLPLLSLSASQLQFTSSVSYGCQVFLKSYLIN